MYLKQDFQNDVPWQVLCYYKWNVWSCKIFSIIYSIYTDSTIRPTPIFFSLTAPTLIVDWVMQFSEIESLSKITTRIGGKKQLSTITASLAHFKILEKPSFPISKIPSASLVLSHHGFFKLIGHDTLNNNKKLTRKSIKYLV